MIKLTNTASKIAEFICLLVYGPSGVGKTKLAATAPKPVIISSEKKLISLKDENIPVILIENHMDMDAAYDLITGPKGKQFETVVIDSVSDIAETVLDYFKKNPVDGNTHPQAAYGHMADVMGPMIKKFKMLPNKHKYIIAKSKRIEDQYTNVDMFSPALPGKVLPGNISYEFDYVFAMRIGETTSGSKYRYLQTQGDIQWTAKGVESLNMIERPNLTAIFNKILGVKTAPAPETEPNKKEEEPTPEEIEEKLEADKNE